jgi:hypothetical protein
VNYCENEMLEEIKESNLLNYFIDLPIMIRDYHTLRLRDEWLYFNIAVWERVYKVKIKNV